MRAFSLDLRERSVAAYDRGEGTLQQVAERIQVSSGMVKKLLLQRRRTGDLVARSEKQWARSSLDSTWLIDATPIPSSWATKASDR